MGLLYYGKTWLHGLGLIHGSPTLQEHCVNSRINLYK
uniref:Uncharacterized protein n=1 Tax=Anguilla anguilla TaxID=7936 RepID=A0A0E9S7N4_ANGAN